MDRLISEQAVIESIEFFQMNPQHFDFVNLIDDIKEIPSAEQNTGHWIENAPEYQNIDPPYICSECGNMHLRKTNYCDQCGAKMVEEQESEDKCKNCEYYHNPDYTRCHECKAESEE